MEKCPPVLSMEKRGWPIVHRLARIDCRAIVERVVFTAAHLSYWAQCDFIGADDGSKTKTILYDAALPVEVYTQQRGTLAASETTRRDRFFVGLVAGLTRSRQ